MNRLRFAPSPTGYLHIGNLRNALFNFLIAKELKGKIILRIEDTDQKREVEGAVKGLIDILNWIGLSFDEGPHLGGNYGPYTQSERKAIYAEYMQELLSKKQAYQCFCTPERLAQMREGQQAKKLPPRYDRKCRDLSETEIKQKIESGENYVIRQKMPQNGEIITKDELRGEIKFNNSELDDQVLIKSDGMPTYQFANVIDDHLMEITHVVRGDEWISSLPKNILLYKAFGWAPPKFIHLPLILNKNGGKLSKRDNDTAVEDYRAKGYLPAAVINFCALQGWHAKDDEEIFNLKELREKFSLKQVGISPAVFDLEKLDYLNGVHIRKLDLEELTKLCLPYLKKYWKNVETRHVSSLQDFNYLKSIVRLEQERMKKLSEITELTKFFFCDKLNYEKELLIWKKSNQADAKLKLEEVKNCLEHIPKENWTNNSIAEAILSHIQAKNGKNGDYLWPMRVALTGEKASPGPFDVAEVLGKVKSIKRVEEGIIKLS